MKTSLKLGRLAGAKFCTDIRLARDTPNLGKTFNQFWGIDFQLFTSSLKLKRPVKSKYIIIKHGGNEIPLVFPQIVTHEDMIAMGHVISAGFCELDAAGKWMVSGRSISLNMIARPQDAELLNLHL